MNWPTHAELIDLSPTHEVNQAKEELLASHEVREFVGRGFRDSWMEGYFIGHPTLRGAIVSPRVRAERRYAEFHPTEPGR
ncbi:MAG TPA: hypothetical protein VF221_21350 [Chloroflexota bacterium]